MLLRGAALGGGRSMQHRLGDTCTQETHSFQTGSLIGSMLKVSESVFLYTTQW